MSNCDSNQQPSIEQTFDEKNFKIETTERSYNLPTNNPANESKMKEKTVIAVSVDGQQFFYSDSKSSSVKSTDPNDLFNALDKTFEETHSFDDNHSINEQFTVTGAIAGAFSGFRPRFLQRNKKETKKPLKENNMDETVNELEQMEEDASKDETKPKM